METPLLMIQAVEQIILQEATYLRMLRLLKELNKMQLISSLMLPLNFNHSTMYALHKIILFKMCIYFVIYNSINILQGNWVALEKATRILAAE